MALVALGQSKMVARPIPAFFHVIIYVGFVLINIEVLEILVDGFTGSHRIFMDVMKHIKEETDTYEQPWSPFRDPMVLFAVGICIGLAWGSTWAR
jgi:hypothetical protein